MMELEKEHLLPLLSPSRSPLPPSSPPVFLPPLPEDEEISSCCFTPSSLKDRLIFGPSFLSDDYSAPSLLDALTAHQSSSTPRICSTPRHSSTPRVSSTLRPSTTPRPSLEADRSSSDTLVLDPQRSLWPSQIQAQPCTSSVNKCLHRCKTAPAMAVISEFQHPGVNSLPKQLTSQSIVKSGFILLVLYLVLGVVIYWFNRHQFSSSETHPVVDALYFCIVTMCTIGYGDITPNSASTKLFSILFVLVGFGFIDILLSGMVSYVLDLQETYLLKTVKSGKDLRSILIDVKKGRMRIRMKVALALGVVVLCIGVGVGVMHFVERLGWLDAFYLSVMSVTTVGYGDHAFKTMHGRIFASIWLLVSTLAVARAFLYLAEARVDKRHRMLAKCVLREDMTVAQFLAADMDNNGFVSKSEYVIYKLKELGKVSEEDVLKICRKFDQLDVGNCGKITLADLMDSRGSDNAL